MSVLVTAMARRRCAALGVWAARAGNKVTKSHVGGFTSPPAEQVPQHISPVQTNAKGIHLHPEGTGSMDAFVCNPLAEVDRAFEQHLAAGAQPSSLFSLLSLLYVCACVFGWQVAMRRRLIQAQRCASSRPRPCPRCTANPMPRTACGDAGPSSGLLRFGGKHTDPLSECGSAPLPPARQFGALPLHDSGAAAHPHPCALFGIRAPTLLRLVGHL